MRTWHLSATWQAPTTCTSLKRATRTWRLLYMPPLTREGVFLLLAPLLQEPMPLERSNNTSGGDSWAPRARRDPSSRPRHTTAPRGAECTPTVAGEGETEHLAWDLVTYAIFCWCAVSVVTVSVETPTRLLWPLRLRNFFPIAVEHYQ